MSLTKMLTGNTILGLKLNVVIALFSVFLLFVISLVCACLCRRSKRAKFRDLERAKKSHDAKIIKSLASPNQEICYKREKEMMEVEISSYSLPNSSQVSSNETISISTQSGAGSFSGAENIGWGRWHSVKELEIATRGFHEECEIGRGGYGIVYRGVLVDGSVIAVKSLLDNKGQAEKEFKVEVEAIGKVRHKNLVGLLGYCAEGTKRLLVYEYVDNGNLEQWLHGEVGSVSPLTWDIRMKIAIGTAKGLAYLHEGLEPKVVHRDVKSSNILLDRKWNAKVSDFGLAKLLGAEKSYVTTRVMGTFGYVSPEYASTGMLNEGSDVYSFGILLMELITGRAPVDYSKAPGEMNLVDWFKSMVAKRRGEEVVDPLIQMAPSPRSLKRALLVCLRCIDMDTNKRPKMGQIVHMLEADEFPFRTEPRTPKGTTNETAPLRANDSVNNNDFYQQRRSSVGEGYNINEDRRLFS